MFPVVGAIVRCAVSLLFLVWAVKLRASGQGQGHGQGHGHGQGQRELHCIVREEVPVDSQVVDLQSEVVLKDRLFGGRIPGDLRFRLLSQPPCDIELEETTGRILTRGRIDREAICSGGGGDSACRFRLDVAVTRTSSFFSIVRLTVEVDDINDNAPEFHPPVVRHEMGEASTVGTAVVLPAARDRDSPGNSVVRYELKSDDDDDDEGGRFELSVRKKPNGATDVRLVLVKLLDRETADFHRMRIVAYDGGNPVQSGSIRVEIAVVDANDNAPVFESESYEASVVENAAPSTTVARVRATDLDLGNNGKVVHSFSPQTSMDHGAVFRIDPSTGEIEVAGVVDYETHPVYRLIVVASDEGQNVLTAETTITVTVEDANDNPPLIVINTLAAFNTNASDVLEGLEPGSFVAQARVVDADSGLGGRFRCSLEDHEDRFALQFTADGEYMIVTTTTTLDRELRDLYDVTMRCADAGEPALSSSRQLGIRVVDSNDHDPRFTRDEYDEEVLENNYIGAVVVHVTATDEDQGDNSRIEYHLPEDLSHSFEIDPNDGSIRAKHSLDRERTPDYRFVVYATDRGLPVRTGSTTVVLRVVDVNDESPTFRFDSSSSDSSLTVTENLPGGTEVGVLSATDADDFPLNVFSFSFLPGGSLSDAFSVDSKTGRITTTRTLDREEREVYHLIAVVRDDNSPILSSTATLAIAVVDVNDNDPTFVDNFPVGHRNNNNGTVVIVVAVPPRRTAAGTTTVAEFRAVDPDAGPNGTVAYSVSGDESLISSSCSDAFAMDSISGRLNLIGDLFRRRCPDVNVTVDLNVTASDHGTPPRHSTARLRLVVEEEETAPAVVPVPPPERLVGLTFDLVLVLVLCLAVGSGTIISIIVVGVVVHSRSRRQRDAQKYNCRMETIKAMSCDVTSKTKDPGVTVASSGTGKKSVDETTESSPSKLDVAGSLRSQREEGAARVNDCVAVLMKSDVPSSGAGQIVSTRTYETIPSNHLYRSSSPLISRDASSTPVLNRKLASRPQPNSLTSLASGLESKTQRTNAVMQTTMSPATGDVSVQQKQQQQNGVRSGNGHATKLAQQKRSAEMTDARTYPPNDDDTRYNYHLDDSRVQVMLLSGPQKTRPAFLSRPVATHLAWNVPASGLTERKKRKSTLPEKDISNTVQ